MNFQAQDYQVINERTKFIALLLCFLLVFEQSGFAQIAGQVDLSRYMLGTGNPSPTDKYRPLHLRYLSYDNQNNRFNLLLDKGDFLTRLQKDVILTPPQAGEESQIHHETQKLMEYFFIGLALPNESFWVNLRPDSPDNVIDSELSKTDIGKILLETDVQLKKDTAAYTSPQTKEGREYWNKLYKKAEELFGADNITIPTLTRPWIIPGEIIISESPGTVYIHKAGLKVMLEEDYLKEVDSRQKSVDSKKHNEFNDPRLKELNTYSTQLIKELVIPKITKEVNTSRKYANLRQVYYSLILAQWFKKRRTMDDGRWKMDARSLTGLTSQIPWSKETYYQQYQKSFTDGEYNLKETVRTPFGQTIRTYVSGGGNFVNIIPPGLTSSGITGLQKFDTAAGKESFVCIKSSSAIDQKENKYLIAADVDVRDGFSRPDIHIASSAVEVEESTEGLRDFQGHYRMNIEVWWLDQEHNNIVKVAILGKQSYGGKIGYTIFDAVSWQKGVLKRLKENVPEEELFTTEAQAKAAAEKRSNQTSKIDVDKKLVSPVEPVPNQPDNKPTLDQKIKGWFKGKFSRSPKPEKTPKADEDKSETPLKEDEAVKEESERLEQKLKELKEEEQKLEKGKEDKENAGAGLVPGSDHNIKPLPLKEGRVRAVIAKVDNKLTAVAERLARNEVNRLTQEKVSFLKKWWRNTFYSHLKQPREIKKYTEKFERELRNWLADPAKHPITDPELRKALARENIDTPEKFRESLNAITGRINQQDITARLTGNTDVPERGETIVSFTNTSNTFKQNIASIKELVIQYILNKVAEDDFKAELRHLLAQISPELWDGKGILASDLLIAANILRGKLDAGEISEQQLTVDDLPLDIEFSIAQAVDVRPRKPQGIITNVINKLQSNKWTSWLTSPGVVSLFTNAAGIFFAWKVTGLFFLVPGWAPVLALAVLVAFPLAIEIGFREAAEFKRNTTLADLRDSLHQASSAETNLGKGIINALTALKLNVNQTIERLEKLSNTTTVSEIQQRRELIDEVLARLELSQKTGFELFEYDLTKGSDQESLKAELLSLVNENIEAPGAGGANTAISRVQANIRKANQNLLSLKRGQVAKSMAWSMGMATAINLGFSGLFFLLGWGQAARGIAEAAATTKTSAPSSIPYTLEEFLGQYGTKINPGELQAALTNAKIPNPNQIISRLFSDSKVNVAELSHILASKNTPLINVIDAYLEQISRCSLDFSASAQFMADLWTKAGPALKSLLGEKNFSKFTAEFQASMQNITEGPWSLFQTFQQKLEQFNVSQGVVKKAETAFLQAIEKTPAVMANLDKVLQEVVTLDSQKTVEYFVKSTLPRYNRFRYMLDPKAFGKFMAEAIRIYNARGANPNWQVVCVEIRQAMDVLHPADKINLLFDFVHRFTGTIVNVVKEAPAQGIIATGDFFKIFFTHQVKIIAQVVEETVVQPIEQGLAAKIPLGIGFAGTAYQGLGLLGDKVVDELARPGAEKGPSPASGTSVQPQQPQTPVEPQVLPKTEVEKQEMSSIEKNVVDEQARRQAEAEKDLNQAKLGQDSKKELENVQKELEIAQLKLSELKQAQMAAQVAFEDEQTELQNLSKQIKEESNDDVVVELQKKYNEKIKDNTLALEFYKAEAEVSAQQELVDNLQAEHDALSVQVNEDTSKPAEGLPGVDKKLEVGTQKPEVIEPVSKSEEPKVKDIKEKLEDRDLKGEVESKEHEDWVPKNEACPVRKNVDKWEKVDRVDLKRLPQGTLVYLGDTGSWVNYLIRIEENGMISLWINGRKGCFRGRAELLKSDNFRDGSTEPGIIVASQGTSDLSGLYVDYPYEINFPYFKWDVDKNTGEGALRDYNLMNEYSRYWNQSFGSFRILYPASLDQSPKKAGTGFPLSKEQDEKEKLEVGTQKPEIIEPESKEPKVKEKGDGKTPPPADNKLLEEDIKVTSKWEDSEIKDNDIKQVREMLSNIGNIIFTLVMLDHEQQQFKGNIYTDPGGYSHPAYSCQVAAIKNAFNHVGYRIDKTDKGILDGYYKSPLLRWTPTGYLTGIEEFIPVLINDLGGEGHSVKLLGDPQATKEMIKALQEGAAVVVAQGQHAVTLTGIWKDEDQVYVQINDPLLAVPSHVVLADYVADRYGSGFWIIRKPSASRSEEPKVKDIKEKLEDRDRQKETKVEVLAQQEIGQEKLLQQEQKEIAEVINGLTETDVSMMSPLTGHRQQQYRGQISYVAPDRTEYGQMYSCVVAASLMALNKAGITTLATDKEELDKYYSRKELQITQQVAGSHYIDEGIVPIIIKDAGRQSISSRFWGRESIKKLIGFLQQGLPVIVIQHGHAVTISGICWENGQVYTWLNNPLSADETPSKISLKEYALTNCGRSYYVVERPSASSSLVDEVGGVDLTRMQMGVRQQMGMVGPIGPMAAPVLSKEMLSLDVNQEFICVESMLEADIAVSDERLRVLMIVCCQSADCDESLDKIDDYISAKIRIDESNCRFTDTTLLKMLELLKLRPSREAMLNVLSSLTILPKQ